MSKLCFWIIFGILISVVGIIISKIAARFNECFDGWVSEDYNWLQDQTKKIMRK